MLVGWSIRKRLLALVVGAMLPLVVVIAYGIAEAWREALADASDHVRSLAVETAANLDTIFRDDEALLVRLAERPLIRAMDPRRCDPVFKELASALPLYTSLSLHSSSGSTVCSFLQPMPAAGVIAASKTFRAAIAADRFRVSDVIIGPVTGRWTTLVSYPVRDERGAVVGLLGMGLNLAQLERSARRSISENAVVAILDRDDKFVLRSIDHAKWVGESGRIAGVADAVWRQPEGLFRAPGVDGIARVWGMVVERNSGWRVLAGLPEDKAFAAARAELVWGIAIVLAAIALALAAALWNSRRIAVPIRALARTVRAAAEGDHLARVRDAGPSEIATVAREFDRMLDERAKEEAKLNTSEKLYRLLFEHSHDAVLLTAPDGRVVSANPEACRMFGRGEAEICRLGRAALVDLEDARLAPALAQRARTGAFHGELTFLRADGTRFEGELTTALFQDMQGETRSSMTIRDVTSRRFAEAA